LPVRERRAVPPLFAFGETVCYQYGRAPGRRSLDTTARVRQCVCR